MSGIKIYLMHILIIGPLLFGIGYKQTNNYMSPYRQQRKSSSPSIDKNNSQRHEYNSPYRQRANAPPIVQISKRNDAFFCNDY